MEDNQMNGAPERIWCTAWDRDLPGGVFWPEKTNADAVEYSKAPQWQPISTAPRDGTYFHAWLTDGRSGRSVAQHFEPLCRFNAEGGFEVWGRIDYDESGWVSDWNPEWKPTHWMPFPEGPK